MCYTFSTIFRLLGTSRILDEHVSLWCKYNRIARFFFEISGRKCLVLPKSHPIFAFFAGPQLVPQADRERYSVILLVLVPCLVPHPKIQLKKTQLEVQYNLYQECIVLYYDLVLGCSPTSRIFCHYQLPATKWTRPLLLLLGLFECASESRAPFFFLALHMCLAFLGS